MQITFLPTWTPSAPFLDTLERNEIKNESAQGREADEEHDSGRLGTMM